MANIAIVGATGLVGKSMLKMIDKLDVKFDKLYLFSSEKSAGKIIKFQSNEYQIIELNDLNINKDIDYALFATSNVISKEYVPKFAKKGIKIIDNSSEFRMEKDVALVVPEINFSNDLIISNPNCSTVQSVLVLNTLMSLNIKRVDYTTYQSVSGSGQAGLEEYSNVFNNKVNSLYPYNISKNVIPQIDEFTENGFTKEEMKMVNESRKILSEKIKFSAFCVRVPVLKSHGVSMKIEFNNNVSIETIKKHLLYSQNVVLYDNIDNLLYPTNELSNDTFNVYVGRIRRDIFNKNIIHLYCTADNLLIGSAYNAVSILVKLLLSDSHV